jgi:epoxyqueuosine reductase
MGIDDRVRSMADEMGADFSGVADLAPAQEAILAQGGAVIAAFPRAISVGVALFDPIVDQLPRHADRSAAMSYRHHCYDVVNQRLDHITSRLGSALQREGFQAFPVPASQTVNDERLYGIFSNKMAAHLAGLGWIGKSCLLVTPEVGPRARWATVLTDAPLNAASESMGEGCGDCQECVDICPPGAFTGRPFREEEPREARFDVHKCSAYVMDRENEVGARVCGLCLYVCPHGRG